MSRTAFFLCFLVALLSASDLRAQTPSDVFKKIREIRRDLWDDTSVFAPASDGVVIAWGFGVAAAGVVLDSDGTVLTCADVFYDAEYDSMFELGAVNYRVPYGTPLVHSVARLERVDLDRNLLLLKVDHPPNVENVIALSDEAPPTPGADLKSATVVSVDERFITVQPHGVLTASGIACLPLLDQDGKLVGLFNRTRLEPYLEFLFISDYLFAMRASEIQQFLSATD